MKVELLYFEGCPSYETLMTRSVRVNGNDVDPTAADRSDVGMKCRLYLTNEGPAHTPPHEWIVRAIAGAHHG